MKMMSSNNFVVVIFIASFASFALAYDPNPLQDFCVATNESYVYVNGLPCKNPETVVSEDFFYTGLNFVRNTTNRLGSNITRVDVFALPGLNTMGLTLVRLDYAPGGINPPHFHPRSSEIIVCMEGILYVGFVTSNPSNPNSRNRLFTKILYPGDVFVFPMAMIHFQLNLAKTNALAFVGQNSQNPGVVGIANAVFGSYPPINTELLERAFQVDEKIINYLRAQFPGNNTKI